ncbi:MAG: TlpA family protein disulfide reductase [Bacteroidales bacterium]|jgi:thiol-disulfide isomerase/thioredoxin|nr:TlpA family protein disulfide reductase [Bacteroidales bacterium]
MKFFKNFWEKYKKKSLIAKILDVLLIALLVMVINPSTRPLFQQAIIELGITPSGMNETDELTVGEEFYDWKLKTASGEIINLQKDKVYFINFWATWCPPCVAELPYIEKLTKRMADNRDVEVITIVSESNEKIDNFMNNKGYSFKYYFQQSVVPANIRKSSIPSTFIIDKSGVIKLDKVGAYKWSGDDIVNLLTKLSKE